MTYKCVTTKRGVDSSLETAFHMLNQGDGIQEFTLTLGTLLDPTLVPVLFALFDTMHIVF